MRVELAKILLRKPDLILLDEPTNHLDIESIMWLENFLISYPGAVILVSHDRTFLDNVTLRTLEISLGRIYDYRVPYTRYTELRRERREQQEAAFRNQQKMIDDTERFIERFRYKPTKAVQVQSKIKQLKKLERIEIEDEDLSAINIRFSPAPRSGTVVVEADEASKRYGSHLVLDRISLKIERGEKVAFVGRNGEGKTTLSRMILRQVDHEGTVKQGHNVSIGYFAQNQDELLNDDLTVFETVDRIARGDIRTRMRDILGAFLFQGDDIEKKVKVLSGGERSRLAIVQLLLEPYNLLLLDEPTNHLDIRSKEILKKALIRFDGTLIVVSHDRDFLDGLVNKVYEFRHRKIRTHLGGISEFLRARKIESLKELEKKDVAVAAAPSPATGKRAPVQDSKTRYLEKKETERVYRRLKRQTEESEAEITILEKEIADMDARLASGDNEVVSDTSFYNLYEEKKQRLDALMHRWEKMHGELEAFMTEYMSNDDHL
jgi:ATP-binding cassette subfamily F protein 3